MGQQLTFPRCCHLGCFPAGQSLPNAASHKMNLSSFHTWCQCHHKRVRKRKAHFIPSQSLSFLTNKTSWIALLTLQNQCKVRSRGNLNPVKTFFQSGKDQKVCQCAPKQPGIAGRETRGWSCGVFGEYLSSIWAWDVLPCAVPDSVPKPILENTHSLLELNSHLFFQHCRGKPNSCLPRCLAVSLNPCRNQQGALLTGLLWQQN